MLGGGKGKFNQEGQKVDVQINSNSDKLFPKELPDGLSLVSENLLPNKDWLVAVIADKTKIEFNKDKQRTHLAFSEGNDGEVFITDENDGEFTFIRGYKTKARYMIGHKGKILVDARGYVENLDISL